MSKKPKTKPDFYTVAQAAEILGISPAAVYQAIKEERLTAHAEMRPVYRITPDALKDYKIDPQRLGAGMARKKSTQGQK